MVRLPYRRVGARQVGYFGSKATSGLCQPLIAMMPPHGAYIETHLGGGAIMKRKPPALRNIGIDRDAPPRSDAFECDIPPSSSCTAAPTGSSPSSRSRARSSSTATRRI